MSKTTTIPIRNVAATSRKVTANTDERVRDARRSDLAVAVLADAGRTFPLSAAVTPDPTGPERACGDQATGRGGSVGWLPTLGGGGTGGGFAGGWNHAGPEGGVAWPGMLAADGWPTAVAGSVAAPATVPYNAAGFGAGSGTPTAGA
jgi:hypothetical protein